jgi:hypothetical protein
VDNTACKKNNIGGTITATRKQKKIDPCIPRPMTNSFAGVGQDGRTSLVPLIRHIPSQLFKPLSFAMGLKRKKEVSRSGALRD